MSSVNKVILIGFVGQDPEVRSVRSGGDKMATISLATSKRWKDRETGDRKEKTEWHRVVVFNDGLASVVNDHVKKGSRIYVEGELATRKWTDNNQVERYTTEVVLSGFGCKLELLDKKGDGNRPPPAGDYSEYGSQKDQPERPVGQPLESGLNDEIPF